VTARLLADRVAWLSGSPGATAMSFESRVSKWSIDEEDVAAAVDAGRRAAAESQFLPYAGLRGGRCASRRASTQLR